MLVYFGCFGYSRITSGSMAPTLQGEDWEGGDRVLTEKVSYWFRKPRRWEVMAVRAEDGKQIMKRVVGLPGEKIQMLRYGRVVIDGQRVRPPKELDFLDYLACGNLCAEQAVECGDGYYVLGDDSRDSDDSRFNGPGAARANHRPGVADPRPVWAPRVRSVTPPRARAEVVASSRVAGRPVGR